MKAAFLTIIVLISYWAFTVNLPPMPLLTLYGVIIFFPILFILVKKNMLNSLLAWFFFNMFGYGLWEYGGGVLHLPLLPDIAIERVIWGALVIVLITGIAVRQIRLDIGITATEIAMILLCSYIIVSMIAAGTIYSEGQGLIINSFLNGYFLPFSFFFLSKYLINDEQKIRRVFIFFAVLGFYLGFTAIAEYFQWKALIFPPYIMDPYKGDFWGRSRGPLLHAPVNGTVIGIFIFITIYLLNQKNNKHVKIFWSVSLIVLLIGLLFTFTRASWLGFLLSSFLLPVFMPKTRKIFLIILITLIILIIVSFSAEQFEEKYRTDVRSEKLDEQIAGRIMASSPVYGRLNLYAVVLRMFLDKPVFGFGFNTFREKSGSYMERIEGLPYEIGSGVNVHDTWSGVLVELGLVGVGLLAFIIWSIIGNSVKLYSLLPSKGILSRQLIVVFLGSAIIYLINIQLIEIRYFLFVNSLFFLIGGIVVGMNQRIRSRRQLLGE